jgi:hypothetical protein
MALFSNQGGKLILYRPGKPPLEAPLVPIRYQNIQVDRTLGAGDFRARRFAFGHGLLRRSERHFRILYVLVVMEPPSRRIVHINGTWRNQPPVGWSRGLLLFLLTLLDNVDIRSRRRASAQNSLAKGQ